ncbi:hypothetical protein HUK65_10020 [Rhodobacteraceae bacterium 2376]|uniref:DnaA N-terminal domain-containing protein n=1 Tax=Rhabdonatronobacter sediminivivens TaxID=2743469 RepID=A0A7Z0L0L0_9RHOB|nr:hypothetical protein [Rhabdonatronobacter sediminivivens]NYS25328.1 hypothetical protein [Rhabdonatronobacter sediminivivens]
MPANRVSSGTLARPVGRNAAALKYDLLSAMGAFALGAGRGMQCRVLRLMTLLTARYNWARDELAVGQREIARLWSVDERTVKREMAKLRAMGWLRLKRQGARGRVSEYGLDIAAVLADTRSHWAAVGPDFEDRMAAPESRGNVVALPVSGRVPAPEAPPATGDASEWGLARALLHAEDPGLYATWIAALERVERAGSRLVLRAPSRFHASYVLTHLQARVLRACTAVDDSIGEITVQS